ncbi:hypothetical protein [Catenulispora rubra]|uniref:hypothetical protein n=1 Tax=Catenulispora rubra TaxID=280293 RepID=UPI001891F933|nr:hypothetical protein [Catenulispora rubra]
MSTEPTPTRRPIAGIRVSTVALLGVVAAIAIPCGAAALVVSGSIDSQHTQQTLGQADPVTRVVVEDSDSTVRITGNAAVSGMTGKADLTWHSFSGTGHPKVTQQYADGVLTLTKDCDGGDCGAGIDIQVPPTVSVQVTTSNASIFVTNVSGPVNLHSTNADIHADQLGSGDAVMNTTNASIKASFVGGPRNITAATTNASVLIVTDGSTLYYDKVSTTNAEPNLQNQQDHRSNNVIDVTTTNAGVTIK